MFYEMKDCIFGTHTMPNGTVLVLQQAPYIDLDCVEGKPLYRAYAMGDDYGDYTLIWYPVEGWQQLEDESARCNWGSPDCVVQHGSWK